LSRENSPIDASAFPLGHEISKKCVWL